AADPGFISNRRVHSSGRLDHRLSRAQRRRNAAKGSGYDDRSGWEQEIVKRPFSSSAAGLSYGTCWAVLLFVGFALRAQQPAGRAGGANAAAAKLEVPENFSEHAAPAQPLPFSHKTHVTRGLQCRQCHTNPEPGNQMT